MLPKNRRKDVIRSFSLDIIHVSFGTSRIDEFDARKLEQQRKKNFSKPFQLGKIFLLNIYVLWIWPIFVKRWKPGWIRACQSFCLVTVFSLVIVRVKSWQIVHVKHANYPQLLKRAELPTLLNRHLQDICILIYKVKHKLCLTYICNLFNNHNSS